MTRVIVGIISKTNSNDELEYLLISANKDFGQFSGHYYPPGGHIEDGETKQEALKREIKEELGLEVEPIEELAETQGDVQDQTTYWWSCSAKSIDMKIDKEEIADARFFTKSEISQLKLWPATKQFFDDYIFK